MKGITFIELLIVISIMLILAGIIIASLPRFQSAVELQSSVEEGMSSLLEAKAQTLSSQGDSPYGVHFETSRIVLFKGTAFIDGAPDNRVSLLSPRIEISEISLSGGGSDVVFKKLTGSTDQHGFITFRVIADPSQTRSIRILPEGVITMLTPPQCEWAVFAKEDITIGGESTINSYDSGGSGGNNQAVVQTNSVSPATFSLGTNAQINGDGVVGYQGNPNTVITLAGGAVITGSRTSASLPVIVPSAPAVSAPPPLAPMPPPAVSGSPLALGSGQSLTVNVCQDVPSEISTGTNATLTLEGDCSLNLNFLTLGSGSTFTINGLTSEIHTSSLSTDTNVNVVLSNALTIKTPFFSLGSGTSLTTVEGLTINAESLTIGTNGSIQTSGATNFTTNTFLLDAGADILVDGAFSLTAQSLTTGTNTTIQAETDATLLANTTSLGGGGNVLTDGNLSLTAASITTGTNLTINAGQILTIQVNTATIGAGNNLSSATTIPKNLTFTVAGSAPFAIGTNVTFRGVLYAPDTNVIFGGGSNIWGSIIGKNITLDTNVSLLYDIALMDTTCA